MPADSPPLLEDESKPIELVLIPQAHALDKSKITKGSFSFDEEINEEVIYSQLKIMQIVQTYPNAAVLVESNLHEVVATDRKKEYTLAFQAIFPNYKTLHQMSFDTLDYNQRTVLTDNHASQVLFQLGIIPAIHQAAQARIDITQLASEYSERYRETLASFPTLAIKALSNKILRPKDFTSVEEVRDYERFQQEINQKCPNIFLNREIEALNFVLRTAATTGKKQVILIFGKKHTQGFLNLLETKYQGRIVLKECIDSTEGFYSAHTKKVTQLITQKSAEAYKSGQYNEAINGYSKAVSFWKATPNSTPTKMNSWLASEYNLGASFFKLAETETDKITSYEKAIPHLKRAMDLALQNYKSTVPKKYANRYEEALKRQAMVSFFHEIPSRIVHLINNYAEEPEILTNK